MSKYTQKPLDFAGLKTISVFARGGKVRVEDFAHAYEKGGGTAALLGSMPRILAADSFRAVVERILNAKAKNRPVLWGYGGHVIKCGLAPVLLDLAKRGLAHGFSTNGSGSIHDFEIGIAGWTSEDVEAVLPDGTFGSAEETGRWMNEGIVEGVRDGLGMGEALGRKLETCAKPEFADKCILLSAYRSSIPVTVHVAVGTDTPHTHPSADGAAIGTGTYTDFKLFCSLVRQLHDGGVYINVGSAVVMPEVFLKAVSSVRNLGHEVKNFTTVNMDFLQHYRPQANVVSRPHAGSGGKGFSLTGHHEIMVPLLAAALIEQCD